MWNTTDIQELMTAEIEAVTIMCRARKREQAPEIHDVSFAETLDIMAGQGQPESLN